MLLNLTTDIVFITASTSIGIKISINKDTYVYAKKVLEVPNSLKVQYALVSVGESDSFTILMAM